jgi:equilibrative nucleoside transporter 1/2/3
LFSVLYNVSSVVSLIALVLAQYYYSHERSGALLTRRLSHPLASPVVVRRSSSRTSWPSASSLATVTVGVADGPPEADHSRSMVQIPLAVYLGVFLLTTILVYRPAASALLIWHATLGSLCVCGICTAVASAGILGSAALWDPTVGTGPYFVGQAAGGLIVALLNVVAAGTDDPQQYQAQVCATGGLEAHHHADNASATGAPLSSCVPYHQVSYSTGAYFLLNCLILASCIVGYAYVDQQRRERKGGRPHYTAVQDVSSDCLPSKIEVTDNEATQGVQPGDGEDTERSVAAAMPPLAMELPSTLSHEEHSTRAVWKVVQLPALALFLTYFVTLAIFPVITSDLTSVHECRSPARLRNDMFVPLTFLVFNLGDIVGRFAVPEETTEKDRWRLPRRLVLASLVRVGFLPLFFLCYSRKSLYKNVAIPSDAFSWLVQFVFAVTNGVLTTASFSVAATLLPSHENLQQIASSILNLSLCLGLVAGGLAASPLLWLFSGHW